MKTLPLSLPLSSSLPLFLSPSLSLFFYLSVHNGPVQHERSRGSWVNLVRVAEGVIGVNHVYQVHRYAVQTQKIHTRAHTNIHAKNTHVTLKCVCYFTISMSSYCVLNKFCCLFIFTAHNIVVSFLQCYFCFSDRFFYKLSSEGTTLETHKLLKQLKVHAFNLKTIQNTKS